MIMKLMLDTNSSLLLTCIRCMLFFYHDSRKSNNCMLYLTLQTSISYPCDECYCLYSFIILASLIFGLTCKWLELIYELHKLKCLRHRIKFMEDIMSSCYNSHFYFRLFLCFHDYKQIWPGVSCKYIGCCLFCLIF